MDIGISLNAFSTLIKAIIWFFSFNLFEINLYY